MPPVVVGVLTAAARLPLAYVMAIRLEQGGLGVAWAVNITLALQTVVLLGDSFWRFTAMTEEPITEEEIPRSVVPTHLPEHR